MSGFRNFLERLEERGELVRIKEELDPRYELAAAMRYMEKKVPFFEKVKGYSVPVVGNLLSNRQRLALALGINPDADVTGEFLKRTKKMVPPVQVASGPVREVTEVRPDILGVIPVLTHHEKDASPYFSSAVTIARDPETGIRGMGIHRIQVKATNRVGIFLGSPPLSEFLRKAEIRGEDLPVAIVIGMDPLTWFASVAYAPYGIDKMGIAGALRGQPVELAPAPVTGLEVPAEAEFLLEGRVLAGVRELDGPFGESNGVYLAYDNPVVQIEAIHHRTNPIYHALLPFNPEESVLIGVSWEAQTLKVLQADFPMVVKMHLDVHDWTRAIIQVSEMGQNEIKKFIEHVLENYPYVKQLVVVDTDINVYDPMEVAFALATRMQPAADIIIKTNLPSSALDPSTEFNEGRFFGSKIGFDATIPGRDKVKFEKISIPGEVYSKVVGLLAARI